MSNLLKFKGSWRDYQRRVLDNLEVHLNDKKLHIVAAPGAGKTTLGIEVISRLNKPVLILCPTNTIKSQWKERIATSFLNAGDLDEIISLDIRNPKYITIITYQALLAAFCGGADIEETDEVELSEEDEDPDKITSSKRFNPSKALNIIEKLNLAKISLLCFDEAHHLRKEWWKALNYLIEKLEPEQTIALTATPPYDVSYSEWEKYEELTGPIDEVISIPELVQNKDLCPHQDFIHISLLKSSEKELLKKQYGNIDELIQSVKNDDCLLAYLSGMSFLNPDDDDIEKIYEDPEFYISIVSLLNSHGVVIPKEFLELFDTTSIFLPHFDLKQAKNFLNGFLISHSLEFEGLEDKIKKYLNLAKKLGLVQNKRIVLNESKKIQKQIANSIGKLDSILSIVECESSSLGEDLRMVILADYIKADDVDNSHLGVVPIWRMLKSKGVVSSSDIGVLCGSLIILHKSKIEFLNKLLNKNNIPLECVSFHENKEDPDFLEIETKESIKHRMVALITELFNLGHITILVGTQALLGEGWDAPSVNSLILSSTVSSFMLSNQMRGRAIRIDKNNPNKVSNIWHLASVDVPNNIMQLTEDDACLYDWVQLAKRFDGYEAPSYYTNEITSGISRVVPKGFQFSNSNLLSLNRQNLLMSKNRELTRNKWEISKMGNSAKGKLSLKSGIDVEGVTVKPLCYRGYGAKVYTLFAAFTTILMFFTNPQTIPLFFIVLIIFLICLLIIGINYLRTGSVVPVLRQIGLIHLQTLKDIELINTSVKNAGINIDKDETESLFITCNCLNAEENNLFVKTLSEFLDPIENPRYVLIYKQKTGATDYFAIPSVFSTSKTVKIFKEYWKKYMNVPCDIVYTRTVEGRKLLLKARRTAFSAQARKKSKKITKWQ